MRNTLLVEKKTRTLDGLMSGTRFLHDGHTWLRIQPTTVVDKDTTGNERDRFFECRTICLDTGEVRQLPEHTRVYAVVEAGKEDEE